MTKIGLAYNIDFVIGLGDNFYDAGLTDVNSTRWNTTWLNVYNRPPLSVVKWYLTAGNHDHYAVCGLCDLYASRFIFIRLTMANLKSIILFKDSVVVDGCFLLSIINKSLLFLEQTVPFQWLNSILIVRSQSVKTQSLRV